MKPAMRHRRSSSTEPRANWIPRSAAAQSGLARTLLKESKLTEAAEHFRAASSLDPQYKEGLLELAAQYEKSNMAPDAIAIYREFPENAAAKERLGQLLIENGNFSAAIPGLESAVKSVAFGCQPACSGGCIQNEQAD